jgi:D-serine deaminase-like pyridoxal phosphate-dependent protein
VSPDHEMNPPMDGAGPEALDLPALWPVVEALGQPGSSSLVPTPCLMCDVDLLSSNIELMQHWAGRRGLALRPHVKSHKSGYVARRQLEAGAVGLSCAKVAEAEALVVALAPMPTESLQLLVTSPLAGPGPASRAAALGGRCDLMVVVDHPQGVAELAEAAANLGSVVTVLCDVDVGLGRTGVRTPEQAVEIAQRVSRCDSLRFGGVQGYAGHAQHVARRDRRREVVAASARRLGEVIAALEANGFPSPVRTGGGTGTAMLDVELGVLTELQPGSYVFMDREYRDALAGDEEGALAQSLTIATTVVSANQDGFVTVDAGLKAMATDAGVPTVVGRPDLSYAFFGDEHGALRGGTGLGRGDRLSLVPPHCDPTVNLYDRIWLTRGDTLEGVVRVDARGASF